MQQIKHGATLKKVITVFVVVLMSHAGSLYAQRLSVGVIGSVQTINSVSYRPANPKGLSVGPVVEMSIPFGLRLQADVLRRDIFLAQSSSGRTNTFQEAFAANATGHSWDVAILAKKHGPPIGDVHPFGAVGIGGRVTSGESQSQYFSQSGFNPPYVTKSIETAQTVQGKTSGAALLGLGADMNIRKRFLLSPQLRYARWSNQPFTPPGVRSSRNSLDLLLSVCVEMRR